MKVIEVIKIRWLSMLKILREFFLVEETEEAEIAEEEGTIQELQYALEDVEQLKKEEDDRIIITKRAKITKLNSMEQLIKTFEEIFPDMYFSFSHRIEELKGKYQNSLSDYLKSIEEKTVTFEIDPDEDSKMLLEINQLESDINNFMEREVKYDILSKRIANLCFKLNIFYNVEIFYSSPKDKRKALAQLEKAKETLLDIVEDTKEYSFFATDKLKKEYLLDFISYADYLILKSTIRSLDNVSMDTVLKNLMIVTEFKGLDWKEIFRDFVLEEMKNLLGLSNMIKESQEYAQLQRRIHKLQNFNYLEAEEALSSKDYWTCMFETENDVLHVILLLGYSKERVGILLLDRFDVGIEESDVYSSVKTQTCLVLSNLLYRTQNSTVSMLLKMFSSLKYDVTYKEVYFVLLLFDVLDLVLSEDKGSIYSTFVKNIEKQQRKYGTSYTKHDIESKKNLLLNSRTNSREYIGIFKVNQGEMSQFSNQLNEDNFDFFIIEDTLYLNAFYFEGLENLMRNFTIKKFSY